MALSGQVAERIDTLHYGHGAGGVPSATYLCARFTLRFSHDCFNEDMTLASITLAR